MSPTVRKEEKPSLRIEENNTPVLLPEAKLEEKATIEYDDVQPEDAKDVPKTPKSG